MNNPTPTPLDPDRPDGPLFVDDGAPFPHRPTDTHYGSPMDAADICYVYTCAVVHPGCTHAAYEARYGHARTCPTCDRLSANYPDLLPAGPALHSTHPDSRGFLPAGWDDV